MNRKWIALRIFFITILAILIASGIIFQTKWLSKSNIPDETSYAEISPNKKWGVLYDNHMQGNKNINSIRILSLDGKTEYMMDDSKLQIYSTCFDFNTVAWSPDNNFLYFEPWTCHRSSKIFGGSSPVLYRIELSTGIFTEVLPIIESKSITDQNFYNYSFSSDYNYLAYIQPNSPVQLSVKNLITGETIQVQFNSQYQEAGCINWLLDEHIFVFSAATTSKLGSKTTSSLFSVNMNTQEVLEIEAPENVIYCAARYLPDTPKSLIVVAKIELENIYRWCDGCVDFLFNPLTGEISPVK